MVMSMVGFSVCCASADDKRRLDAEELWRLWLADRSMARCTKLPHVFMIFSWFSGERLAK